MAGISEVRSPTSTTPSYALVDPIPGEIRDDDGWILYAARRRAAEWGSVRDRPSSSSCRRRCSTSAATELRKLLVERSRRPDPVASSSSRTLSIWTTPVSQGPSIQCQRPPGGPIDVPPLRRRRADRRFRRLGGGLDKRVDDSRSVSRRGQSRDPRHRRRRKALTIRRRSDPARAPRVAPPRSTSSRVPAPARTSSPACYLWRQLFEVDLVHRRPG